MEPQQQLNASFLTKLLLSICLLSLSLSAGAQTDKRDYIWLFGHNSGFGEGMEAFTFDFNQGSTPKSIQGVPPIAFIGNNASICDKDGNLLYYTNGCHIVGADHQILPNSSGLNPGEFITQFREDTCTFYSGLQDLLFINDPAEEGNVYLIHKTIGVDGNSLYMDNLKYSYIDNSLNNGKGDVTIKNKDILEVGTRLLFSNLTALQKTNGKLGWWILTLDEKDKIHIVDVSVDGIKLSYSLETNTEFVANSSGSGIAKFSPNGNSYAFYNPYDDLHIYEFDRTTGELSNKRYMLLEEFPDNLARFSSLEWSPDSRFIYIALERELWQVDTWESDLRAGLELIDTWNGASDPFQTTFSVMNLAPDCKIYMSSHSGTNTYHVINNPDAKGQDCDFVQQGIRLPHVSATASMPNFPRYRVDEEDKCDPTITSIFGDDIYWRRDLVAYPNPMVDQLTVELPDGEKGRLYVFDSAGQLLWQSKETYIGSEVQLDMSGYATGTYSVEFVPEENKERRLWTSWVVKVD